MSDPERIWLQDPDAEPSRCFADGRTWAESAVNGTDTEYVRADLASGLAASQCHAGYGDEGGRWRCCYQDRIDELDAQVAELQRDKERLDWLAEEGCGVELVNATSNPEDGVVWAVDGYAVSEELRPAIDAAREADDGSSRCRCGLSYRAHTDGMAAECPGFRDA